MKAYDLAMTMVFINCAFPIIDLMGIHTLQEFNSNIWLLNAISILYLPIFNIGGIDINGMILLAGGFAAATIVVLSSNPVTDRGLAMILFVAIFWGSLTTASLSLMGIIFKYPGFTIFWTIFLLSSTLIFINAMVQFPTGGQGATV